MRFQITDAVKHLIIINIVMFIGTVSVGNGQAFYEWFTLFFPKNDARGSIVSSSEHLDAEYLGIITTLKSMLKKRKLRYK